MTNIKASLLQTFGPCSSFLEHRLTSPRHVHLCPPVLFPPQRSYLCQCAEEERVAFVKDLTEDLHDIRARYRKGKVRDSFTTPWDVGQGWLLVMTSCPAYSSVRASRTTEPTTPSFAEPIVWPMSPLSQHTSWSFGVELSPTLFELRRVLAISSLPTHESRRSLYACTNSALWALTLSHLPPPPACLPAWTAAAHDLVESLQSSYPVKNE